MDLGLTGAKALVTGASRGIGRAIAGTLAAEGCALALCARGEEELAKAAAELRAEGATVFAEPVDVTDPDALAGFVERAAGALDGLDLLVSNVSAGNIKGPESWEASLRGDLIPFAGLVEAALPYLEASDRAAVVAIGTTNASDTARPAGANSYSALKAAVVQHASALAHALAPKGIRVNTVSPGPIDFPAEPGRPSAPAVPRCTRRSSPSCRSAATAPRRTWRPPWRSCSAGPVPSASGSTSWWTAGC